MVYAIQSFGPEPTNTGPVFLDDVSFAVPEPGTALLLASWLLALAAARRVREGPARG